MKSVRDLPMKDQRVLVRVDFNVPVDDDGAIVDDLRMRQVLPTLHHVLDHGGRLVICSHRGRPGGKRVREFSLQPVAEHLGEMLGKPVRMAGDCVGTAAEKQAAELAPGEVLMLENLRFHAGETANDPDFSARLARLADVYVNDAFAASHRAHASVVGVAGHVEQRGAGLLLEEEIDYFNRVMENPVRPLVAIIGGAKVSSKLGALRNMLDRVDKMIIGGAMANTFLKSQGVEVGGSLVEKDLFAEARQFIAEADRSGVKLYLPVDWVAAETFAADAAVKQVTIKDMVPSWLALDIGPATTIYFQEAMADARTIVWNGPMGAFEIDLFARGTMALCQAVASSHALSVIGGGDSNAAVKKAGLADRIGYMSTGGGAFLMLMEGKTLPGVAALA